MPDQLRLELVEVLTACWQEIENAASAGRDSEAEQ
jgi:hypothetical protein